MNKEQSNYLLNSFLQYGICGNKNCSMWLSAFLTNDYSRCPICNEPTLLSPALEPIIKKIKSKNIFERYFPSYDLGLFKKNDILMSSDDIGNTPLSENLHIRNWTGIKNLYLKEEYKNPSGSFKDRGTWTAISLLREKLIKTNSTNKNNSFILGTVSTGNMAISTAFMINKLNNLIDTKLKSFIVVNANISKKKIQAIEKAAGKMGTTIFIVKGNYANFHDKVYTACRQLRNQGIAIHAQLTDDMFRIVGYGTLFAEIIDQLKKFKKEPDVIILPVASGALFRVAIWSLESLKKQKIIQKIPQVILVQESGADPIVQAFNKKLKKVKPIKLKKNLLADGIDVSYSRSGNYSLHILQKGYHKCVNVSSKEIREAYEELSRQNLYTEEASAASVAAAKKLYKEKILSKTAQVICVLTGGNISNRNLGNLTASKKISCSLNELEEKLKNVFTKNDNQLKS